MNGQLLTHDFLEQGIQSTDAWTHFSDTELDAFSTGLDRIFAPYSTASAINEAITESEIISKVLSLLGWDGLSLPQVTASGGRRDDVPDMLLFDNAQSKALALRERRDHRRYRYGIAIVESKRLNRPLDRGDVTDRLDPGTPSNQILRYLSTAEVASDRVIQWGILTNGRLW